MLNKSLFYFVSDFNITVSNATFGDGDEHSLGTEIRSGENEVSWYNFANFLSSVILKKIVESFLIQFQ
jgi:hypothetical protein